MLQIRDQHDSDWIGIESLKFVREVIFVPIFQNQGKLHKSVINESIGPNQLRIIEVDYFLHRNVNLHEIVLLICYLQNYSELGVDGLG